MVAAKLLLRDAGIDPSFGLLGMISSSAVVIACCHVGDRERRVEHSGFGKSL